MKIKKLSDHKGIGFYLGLANGITGLIALLLYAVYGARNGTNALVIAMLVLNILAVGIYCGLGLEFISLISAVLSAIAIAGFFCDIYGTFIDYVYKVNFWGDVSQLGIVTAILITTGISCLFSVAGCFIERCRKKM